MELKSLKSKISLKQNMNLAQDIEVVRKTKSAIERISILKEDCKNLDKEYYDMQLQLQSLEPKMEIQKQMLKEARELEKLSRDQEKQKALDIVKQAVRIYGTKNLNKILKGELTK